MSVYRKWYCTCKGLPVELVYEENFEEEKGEPFCQGCGATPSSDPKQTVLYRDIEDWED
ncbi:hypothetical protein DSOUD_3040 [Desulfuromonas soudanensis]|uniref:Uncharacterized protein n=1 Tax=Desulfuromonas soudanensis TaxID=1603606 RepID=A0A0M4CYW8_9BACT|nr:hypothetical protein [Desulfuromonas soudanensis]ALC17766.1 hypothetical protein DSOUD_3040 [Desulfuromonas soudanensis]